MQILCAVDLKAVKYKKQNTASRIINTKTLNLADMSSFLRCVNNKFVLANSRKGVLRATNFGFAARSSNSQLVTQNLFTFRDKLRVFVSRETSLAHEVFHVE